VRSPYRAASASSGTQGALSTLFVFYLAAFAGFTLWTILALPDLFPVFKWPYIWTSAFVRLVDYSVPVTVAGLAVAYSLFLRPASGGRAPFHKVVGSQLTLLVTLSVLYSVALFGFYPRSRTLLTELEELTRHGRALLEDARGEVKQGRPQEALDSFERYLAINRKDDKVSGELDGLRARLHAPAARPVPVAETPQAEAARGERPDQLLARARGHFEREDWFSAVYYADLAVRVSGERPDEVSREARRLSSRAWERIRGQEPGKMSLEGRDLFERKQAGVQIFEKSDFLSAYYHFLELARRFPQDQDAKRWLAESRAQITRLTYFRDEAERMDPLPGPQGLLFVNPRSDGQREIVSIGKMVSTAGEIFFKDLEVLRLASGRVVLHYLAPYGKLESSQAPPPAGQGASTVPRAGVLLRGIDRERSGRDLLPRPVVGSVQRLEPRNLLSLAPRPEQLPALRSPGPAGRSRLGAVSLDTLWLARAGIGAFGQLESALSLEILMRLLLPFVFLNLGLLATALGWSYRLVGGRRPALAAYLVIPLFPVAAALLAGVYLKVHRALAAYALLAWGFRPALVGLAVLQGAILAVLLVVLAGRGND
jgi:hypothetical protein